MRAPRHERLVRDLRVVADPTRRYVDLAVAFRPVRRVGDVALRGQVGPPIGYRWDKWTARVCGPALAAHVLDARADTLPLVLPSRASDSDALFGGRQASKSFGAADRVLLEMLLHPGQLGLVASPTYQQGRQIFTRVLRRLPRDWLMEKPRKSPPATVTLWNGAMAEFVSLNDPDSARSRTIAWAVIDEFGLCPPDAIANVVMSGVVEGADFRLFVTATPNRQPWLRRWYDEHRGDAQSRVLHASTRGNPWMRPGNFARLGRSLGPRLRDQELEGLFPLGTDRCYPDYDERVHVVDRVPLGRDATREFLAAHFYGGATRRRVTHVGGHDWGKRVQASWIGRVWRGAAGQWMVHVEREIYSFGKTVERHAEKVREALGRDGCALLVCDASDPEKRHGRAVFDDAGIETISCGPKNPLQRHRIEAVNNLLDEEPGTSRSMLRCVRDGTERLRDGLLGVLWSDHDTPRQDKATPSTDRTHGPDALGYFVWRHFAPSVYTLRPRADEKEDA